MLGVKYSTPEEALESLGEVPLDETESGAMVLANSWNGFGKGTPIEECWAWIEEVFGISVGDIMYKGE